MFRGLVASMPDGVGSGFARGGVLSTAIHLVLVGAAVFGTRQDAEPVKITPVYLGELHWIPEARPDHRADLPWGLRATFPVIRAPELAPLNIPPIESRNPSLDLPALAGVARDTTARVLGIYSVGGGNRPYLESAVDEKPELMSSPPLEYPELLRQAGIEGAVTFEVIIDTTGHAEPATVRVVAVANRAFETSARRVVLQSLFRPGRVQGRPVRVLVQIPVTFTIRR